MSTSEGETVAILNRNRLFFYCVLAGAYEALIDWLKDMELNAIADARAGKPVINVLLDEL